MDALKRKGRGFVDGVVASGRGEVGSSLGREVDWTSARHLFNGRLECIENPLEKGRRLLEQAIEVDGSHEEARIYLAFLLGQDGMHLRASQHFSDVFETSIDLTNRGHAAMQLGRIFHREGDLRGALRHWRWMSIAGLVELDSRFALVYFNIGIAELERGFDDRALDAFQRLFDVHRDSGRPVEDVARLFTDNEDAREIIDGIPGFLARLAERLPELFDAPESAAS